MLATVNHLLKYDQGQRSGLPAGESLCPEVDVIAADEPGQLIDVVVRYVAHSLIKGVSHFLLGFRAQLRFFIVSHVTSHTSSISLGRGTTSPQLTTMLLSRSSPQWFLILPSTSTSNPTRSPGEACFGDSIPYSLSSTRSMLQMLL